MDSFTTSFQGYQGKDIISLLLSFTLSFSLILALVHRFPILVFIQLVFNHWASFFINSTLWRNTVLQNKLWRKNRFPSIFVAKENNCQIYIMIFFRWLFKKHDRATLREEKNIEIIFIFILKWHFKKIYNVGPQSMWQTLTWHIFSPMTLYVWKLHPGNIISNVRGSPDIREYRHILMQMSCIGHIIYHHATI